jgi:hypothetical protein
MRKYTNEYGKECYDGVEETTPFSEELFHMPEFQAEDGENFAFHTNLGSLTVVDRMTGFGWRDVESGYRAPDGQFWIASGDIDVRFSDCKTVGEAIAYVKRYANTCVPEQQQ